MFHKLHRQMTFFCTAVTGVILIALTAACLLVAENGLKKSSYASFLNESSAVISHFQEQNTISLSYLNQLRGKNNFECVLYENDQPLFFQHLTQPEETLGKDFINLAIQTAEETYHFPLFSNANSQLISHIEFTLTKPDEGLYYVCAAKIPKETSRLSLLIFYSFRHQQRQITRQRVAFAFADLLGILLLTAFSWFFTGRMLGPIEENNSRQTHFIASASHELRTPLAVILSGLEAYDKSTDQADRQHFKNIMQREGQRMQRLIADMLLLANSDANSLKLQTEDCQPDELLLFTYEKYELLAAQKQIALKLRLPDIPLPNITCDRERILQVLSILTDNALAYTPAGGTVTLSAAPAARTGTILLQVIDTGSGVPDTDKKQIFERFYRAQNSHTDKEHFGLGLCIAKEITEAHGGKIFAADAPEGGARFCVIL